MIARSESVRFSRTIGSHVEDNRRIIMGMLAEVINGLDARQKEHLVRKINEYSDDLREIAARG